jgi:hypothetical protein
MRTLGGFKIKSEMVRTFTIQHFAFKNLLGVNCGFGANFFTVVVVGGWEGSIG